VCVCVCVYIYIYIYIYIYLYVDYLGKLRLAGTMDLTKGN